MFILFMSGSINASENRYLNISLTLDDITQEFWWDMQSQKIVRVKYMVNNEIVGNVVGEEEVRGAGYLFIKGDFNTTTIIEQEAPSFKIGGDDFPGFIVKYTFNPGGNLDVLVRGDHQSGTWKIIGKTNSYK